MLLLFLLSLFAGALTTLAGMGGGLILLLGLSTAVDPLTALVITGPALLVGNLHRLALYRRHVDHRLAWRFALGAGPGALLGGLLAVGIPELVLRIGMIALAVVAAGKVLSGWRITTPPGALVGGGALAGFVTATSGGGGLIAGPLWLSSGLTGRSYVATGAIGAASVHVARMTGYGAGGVLDRDALLLGVLGALGIALGNLGGERLRRITPSGWVPRLEIGVVVLCLGLALVGLA